MARIPGIDNLFAVLQSQSEALSALPRTVESLTTAVRGLADTVAQARETLTTVNRLATRLDGLVEELEEPLRAVAPGLTRLAKVLDDPVVEDLPDTLRKVQADLLPVLRTVADTHERVAFIAGSTERMMGFVEDTSRTFGGLPGAGLLGLRRPAGRPAGGAAAGPAAAPGLPADQAGTVGGRTVEGETVEGETVEVETVEGELLSPDQDPR